MELFDIAILFAGGVLAGVINVMAGGAGFMTFPLLIAAGMTPLEANASNFVALVPANLVGAATLRRELVAMRRHLWVRLALASVAGGAGTLLVIKLGSDAFARSAPFLLALATVSFALAPRLRAALARHRGFGGARFLWLSLLLETILYAYGGYFGLGVGILLLAVYTMFSPMTLIEANALRNATVTLLTLVGIALFAQAGLIRWPQSLVMMSGAVAGGWATAGLVRRVPEQWVRRAILAWAAALTAYAFWRWL